MASTGVAAATAGVSAATAARGMPAASSSTRGVSAAARSARMTTAAGARRRVRATITRRSARSAVARSTMVARVPAPGIPAVGRCPRDRLPHIQLRTGRGSAPVAARVRSGAAGFDRTWRSPVPIAAAAAACHRAARRASRHPATRWRGEGPEAIPVAGRSRRRHTALRFHGSRTHVRRTRVGRTHVRPFRRSKSRATIAARRGERTISATVSSLR